MKDTLKALLKKLRTMLTVNFKQNDVKLPYIIMVLVALAVVVAGINLFIELTEGLQSEALAVYDQSITDYVISYRSPQWTQFFIIVTNIGDLYGYIAAIVLCSLLSYRYFKHWKYVFQVVIVLLLASISNLILKHIIDRARPGIEHLVPVESLSYPSGHAMSAMAFYGFVIYLFYRFKMNVFLKVGIIILLTMLIFIIGISRIYLGVHFPSDIAGGYIAGLIWVVFCVLIFDLIEIFRKDPKT